MAAQEKIAVLGAGSMMGLAIARNLAKAGFDLRGWNRSPAKAEPLREDGGEVLESPAEAVSGATVLLTMLADGEAVTHTMQEALSNGDLGEDAVWLQMSTIGEAGIEQCIELAREREVSLVDAPVLGTKQPAQEGELVILASGPEELRERLEPVFEAIGKKSMWVGEAGAGSRLKVATNAWIVALVEGAAETLALAEGMGLDPQLVLDAVEGGPLDLPYLQMKGKAMIERSFEPSFRFALAAKDAGLAQASAERHDLDLPMLHTIQERFEQGAAKHGDDDMAATYLTSTPRQ